MLVEEAGLALGQENLVDALCVLSSTETGVISSDNIQDLLLQLRERKYHSMPVRRHKPPCRAFPYYFSRLP